MHLILPTRDLHQIPAHGGNERTFHLYKGLLFCQDRAKGVDHSFSCAVTIIDTAPFPARGHKRLHIMKDSSSRLSRSVLFHLFPQIKTISPAITCLISSSGKFRHIFKQT